MATIEHRASKVQLLGEYAFPDARHITETRASTAAIAHIYKKMTAISPGACANRASGYSINEAARYSFSLAKNTASKTKQWRR